MLPTGSSNVSYSLAGSRTNGMLAITPLQTPALTSLSPTSGMVGSSVTLTGTNLTGATGVRFNGTAATTFAVVNATTVTATVPTGATSGNVTVTTAGGTSNGVAFAVMPPTNNALAFDGADDYVRIPDDNSLDFGDGDFTVEAWVLKQANSASYSNAIGPGGKWNTGASPGTNEWLLQTTLNGSDNLPSFWLESGTTIYTVSSTVPVPLSIWTHLTGVRQGGSLLLYVNGLLQGTTAIPTTAAVNNIRGLDLLLGAIANNGSPNYFATERLDELRIYNAALTAAQIQADMFSTTSALPDNQVAYYNFDQGTAGGNNAGLTSLPDQGGSGNNGT